MPSKTKTFQPRAQEYGNGNRAARREAIVRSFEATDSLPLSPNDIDRLHEEWQHRRKTFPKLSFHD